ncbi:ATP-dependent protease [Vibrio phage 5P1c]|nr:putative Clp protease [Vibrio phage 495E54-1]CAH9014362.1 putative Clp protease [Vibrio phage 496E54-1]
MSDTQPNMAIRTSSKPLATQYDVMFDRDISGPNEWHEEFFVMRQCEENDVCNIHINTCGGSVATISAFQNIKAKSAAHFHGILEGVGYSAGSAFFLMCDTQEVGDLAEMMIHTSQGSGFYSHSQGRAEYGKQSQRTAEILVKLVYKDFLSEEEIEDVLKGAEVWLDAYEIRERLEKRQKVREQEAIDEMKKQYTPEFYSQQCALDIIEDCEQFGYDPIALAAEIFKLCQESVEGVGSESKDIELPDTLFEEKLSGYNGEPISSIDRIDHLKQIADDEGVKYPHNIGIEKLREKILKHLDLLES